MIAAGISLTLLLTILRCTAAPAVIVKDGVRFIVWKADADDVRIVWKDGAGEQIRDFPAAKDYLEAKGESPVMLMNGGIFEQGGVPSGVMAQEGKELLPVNLKDGKGNFFLKPNGIFLISDNGARVVEASKYPPEGERILYAVQSGPLLLEGGKIHPAFNEGSASRLLRNGVGVAGDGTVVFAISDSGGERWPNLFGFAELFRSLGCADALFLDGDISQMRFGAEMGKESNRFASVIAVVEEVKSAE